MGHSVTSMAHGRAVFLTAIPQISGLSGSKLADVFENYVRAPNFWS